jgi:hypothetical protein
MYRRIVATALLAGTLVGGGVARAQTTADPLPANLAVPAGQVLLLETAARGAQVYGCQPRADNPAAFEWTLRGPDALLLNARGEQIGRHFAGPTWEGNDGSKIVAAARETANSPDPQAVPWLLLEARSNDGAGVFSAVTYIQRLATTGGRAPATGCDQAHVGDEQRVDYTATYVFYYPAAPEGR